MAGPLGLKVGLLLYANLDKYCKGYIAVGSFADLIQMVIPQENVEAMGLIILNVYIIYWLDYTLSCMIDSTGMSCWRPRRPRISKIDHQQVVRGDGQATAACR